MGIIEDYLIKKYNTNMLIKEYAMLPDFVAGSPKAFWYFILNNIY